MTSDPSTGSVFGTLTLLRIDGRAVFLCGSTDEQLGLAVSRAVGTDDELVSSVGNGASEIGLVLWLAVSSNSKFMFASISVFTGLFAACATCDCRLVDAIQTPVVGCPRKVLLG